jgi:hypothetical protein
VGLAGALRENARRDRDGGGPPYRYHREARVAQGAGRVEWTKPGQRAGGPSCEREHWSGEDLHDPGPWLGRCDDDQSPVSPEHPRDLAEHLIPGGGSEEMKQIARRRDVEARVGERQGAGVGLGELPACRERRHALEHRLRRVDPDGPIGACPGRREAAKQPARPGRDVDQAIVRPGAGKLDCSVERSPLQGELQVVQSGRPAPDANGDVRAGLDAHLPPTDYWFRASSETDLTPYLALASRARSEMNSYGFSRISSIVNPAASIAPR